MSDTKIRARCPFGKCNCSIISYNKDQIVTLPASLIQKYKLTRPSSASSASTETEAQFFITENIWDFDNIGVSRSIESLNLDNSEETKDLTFNNTAYRIVKATKYLICADCDKGPLGVALEVQSLDDAAASSSSSSPPATTTLNILLL